MIVQLYSGSFKVVEKSGVGQALYHQRDMLESVGITATFENDSEARIIHFNTVFANSFFAAIFSKFKKKKVIYYAHSTMEDFKNSFKGSNFFAPLFRFWIRICYQTGDIIITPTEYSKRLLTGYGIKKPIYALSNGIDNAFFKPDAERRADFRKKYDIDENEKVVISAGHYIERKGIVDYIELAKRMPDIKFFWFGHTNLKFVPAYIKQAVNDAPSNIVFPGYVERDELRDAYCGCDVFDFMSKEETEGIVVLEALACGIPVVVRDIPVYDGWLEHGVNVYKAKSVDDYCKYTKGIFDHTLPDTTDNGLAIAEERSIHSMGEKLLHIYRENGFYNYTE